MFACINLIFESLFDYLRLIVQKESQSLVPFDHVLVAMIVYF